MTAAIDLFQVLLLIAVAPLIRGVIARIKARIQNRHGASVWRPYADLWKLLHKEDLVPPSASTVFRLAPIVLFAVTAVAAAFVPVLRDSALLGVTGDFILLVYLLALGRFFLMLGAMDGGSAFGGMGASREALVSTLAEAPLLLGLLSVAIAAHTASIAGIVHWTLGQDFSRVSAIHALAFAALALVAIAETGRIPVDNPTTHLELTMIHEAMVLEYSGPSLALIEWASAIKLTVVLALLIALFAPWGMATTFSVLSVSIALFALLAKVAVLAVGIAVIESSVAKLRMYLVPDFLGVATALAILAVVFTAVMR
ncbi:MAG: NADH-quinone oxidoreductase subunit H [Terriglobia bacterium]|jgi:formate hydrogenlyase subunit 4|nr:NADH-quinone oxidoreductase subunit H [Terriglobia bacterium]